MPAGSEASLPRTWRPLGVRLAVTFFGVLLVLVCGFAWFGFSEDVRDRFTLFQRGTLVFLGALFGSVGWALGRSRVVAEPDRLVVVNGFRRRSWSWAEVVAIRLPRGAPWAILDLADGTTASVMALQATDGDRALAAVREVRALLDRRP
jgi:hypothetical protein